MTVKEFMKRSGTSRILWIVIASSILAVGAAAGRAYAQGAPDSCYVRTWYDKRWANALYKDKGDSLGTLNPDTTSEYVDWHPQFSAINRFGQAVSFYRLQIGTTAGGAQIWDTGKTAMTSTPNNTRCPFITYDNADTILQSGVLYHWRIKFYTSTDSTPWSDDNTFMGIIPDNIDSVACCSTYTQFTPIFFGTSHDQLPSGYTVNLQFPTGFGNVVYERGIHNGASPFIVHHKKFTYVSWEGESDTPDEFSIFVAKYNDSSKVWVDTFEVCPAMGSDPLHYYPKMVIGADEKLYLMRGGHHDQSKLYITKAGHVDGSGIDISSWHGGNGKSTHNNLTADSLIIIDTTQNWTENLAGWTIRIKSGTGASFSNIRTITSNNTDTIFVSPKWTINPDTSSRFEIYQAPAALNKSTYPHLVKVNDDMFIFFRHSSTHSGKPRKYMCYTKSTWNGSSYGTWSPRRYVVNYHDSQEPAADSQSVYPTIFNLPGSNRVHALIGFWDNYGVKNKGRAVAYIYSDLDTVTGEFKDWYQKESPTKVGVTHDDSVVTDSVVDYGSTAKIAECQRPSTDTLIGPYPAVNQLLWMGNVEDNNSRPFVFYNYMRSGNTDTAVTTVFAKWHEANQEWVKINLGGKTRFRAKTTGDHNAYTVQINSGTLRGKKFTFRSNTSPDTLEIFDNVVTYDTLLEAVNHGAYGYGSASKIIRIEYVGNELPDTTAAAVNLANGGTGMYSYYEASKAGEWDVVTHIHNAPMILDGYRLYIYGVHKPWGTNSQDSAYFGGEIVRWNLENPIGDNYPVITKTAYTENSGKGMPIIAALSRVVYGYNKEIVYTRAGDLIWSADKTPKANQISGNDVRVIMASIDTSGTKSYLELDRLAENQFGLKTTNILFKIGGTVPANSNYATNVSYIIASGDPAKAKPSVTLTNVFEGYDGFEKYATGTNLDATANWVVTPSGAIDSAKVLSGYDVANYGSYSGMIANNPDKSFQGLHYLRLKDSTHCVWDITNGTDREITARLRIQQPGYGRVWLGVMDASTDSNIVLVGVDGNSCIAAQNVGAGSGALSADTAYGTDWTNPMNARLSDNLLAYTATTTNALVVKDFDFAPTNNSYRVLGISVVIEGRDTSATPAAREVKVGLTKDGSTIAGSWKTDIRMKNSLFLDTTITLGGSSDLWGTTWTLAELQSPNFGILVKSEAGQVWIDRVDIAGISYQYMQLKDTLPVLMNEYHTAKIIVNDDSSYETHCYIDGKRIARYNKLTSSIVNTIVIGSDDSTDAVVDAVEYRRHVWNAPEMTHYRSLTDLLGIEDPPIDIPHVRRIKIIKGEW